jgi:hypothetical protein
MSYDGYDINPNGYREKLIPVTEDSSLILIRIGGPDPDQNRYARNVYYVDKNRHVIWQIETDILHPLKVAPPIRHNQAGGGSWKSRKEIVCRGGRPRGVLLWFYR